MKRLKKYKWIALPLSVCCLLNAAIPPSLAYIIAQTEPAINTFVPFQSAVGDLIISKTVEHPYGEDYVIPQNIKFDFEVDLGTFFAEVTFITSQGELTADENGVLRISVKPGESVGIEGIDEDTQVTVTEILKEGSGFAVSGGTEKRSVMVSSENPVTLDYMNVYTPLPVSPEQLTVSGEKLLEGRDWQAGDSFQFLLEQKEETGTWNTLETAQIRYDAENSEFNQFDFSSLIRNTEFTQPGTYSFRVKETEGSLPYMIYDMSEFTFDIVVTDTDMDGSLEIQDITSAAKDEVTGAYTVEAVFTNIYEEPEETTTTTATTTVTTTESTTTTTELTTTTTTEETTTTAATTTATTTASTTAGSVNTTTTATTTTAATTPTTTASTTAGPTNTTTTATTTAATTTPTATASTTAGPINTTTTATTTAATTTPTTIASTTAGSTNTTTTATTTTAKATTTTKVTTTSATTTVTQPSITTTKASTTTKLITTVTLPSTTTTKATTTTAATTTTTTTFTETTTTSTTTSTTITTTKPTASVTTTTTTSLPPDIIPVASEIVAVPKEPNFYFSVDDREFDPEDLLESVVLRTEYSDGTVVEVDIIDQVDYNGLTPEIAFSERDETADYDGVYRGYPSPYYKGEILEDVKSLVYVAVKGDADLNGRVEINDASEVLEYYAKRAAGFDVMLLEEPVHIHYEYLAYFLADVDTESTAGQNTENNRLEISDASNILTYYARSAAGLYPQWDEIIPSLKELAGSLWYERLHPEES